MPLFPLYNLSGGLCNKKNKKSTICISYQKPHSVIYTYSSKHCLTFNA